MTLARRLSLTTIATTICLAAIAIAAMVGLDGMSRDIGSALKEYAQLRRVYEIGLHAVRARTLLDSYGEPSIVIEELERTRSKLYLFLEETGAAENEAVISDLADLQMSVATGVREEYSKLIEPKFAAVIRRIAELTKANSDAIKAAQVSANERRRTTVIIVATLTGVIIIAAVAISMWQYVSVIGPLRRMRRGVKKIAAGELTDRVDTTGDREFADLARDFNQMAEHLDTLYRDLEDKVRDKSRELVRSERLASVGFLAAGVAHEINNPLGIMSGYAELSLKKIEKARESKKNVSDELERAFTIICEEAFRCKSIIEKLLGLTRRGEDVRTAVDLGTVARDVAEMVEGLPYYLNRSLELKINSNQSDALTIQGNATELKQVLLNLAVNALEAVEQQTGKVEINVSPLGNEVMLTVRDNGKGMSAETLEHVFEPFYTEKRGTTDDNTRRGTGLGLAITHVIIEQHEGRITAASPGLGKGSTFTLFLPRGSKSTTA